MKISPSPAPIDFAQSDLEQALGDRDLQHREDADAADEQRDAGDREEDDAPVAQDP